ncbi:hypothetical protein [Alistipes sp. AF48-12]|uniref:hypothetical protein n=1 Tax=Alistipes sp. AF48-12 TaxID=2291998 RepID=UPI002174D9EB|nr:hypothetical protein [Alistipes sp. AF48-12]
MKLILLAVASCALTWASCTRELVVEVTNPTGLERIYETVEIPWQKSNPRCRASRRRKSWY